jgi:hypothetical protein
MAQVIRETKTTQEYNPNTVTTTSVQGGASIFQTIEYLIYFIFGILEILLVFRLALKLMGASVSSSFVSLIYSSTEMFVAPFVGIFRGWFVSGAGTTSIFEPATLIAIIVYSVVAWGIVRLLEILSGEQQVD